jgi:excisionase family DNA binding protein
MIAETQERPVRLLLKAGEVQELTGWSRPLTYRLMASGELPSIRVGRSLRVHVTDLNDFIARHRIATDE